MKSACFLLTRVLLFILFAGCTSEEPGDNNGDVNNLPTVMLYTNDNNTNTRTTIDETGVVKWAATDTINVNGNKSTVTEIFDGGDHAKFTVQAKAPYCALYPSKIVKYFDTKDEKFAIELPTEQPYKNNISFDDNINPSVAYSINETLHFMNLCGVLKMTLAWTYKAPVNGVSRIRFLFQNKFVTGGARVDPKTVNLDVGPASKNYVDITFPSPRTFSTGAPLDVSLVLPSGYYAFGWTIQLFDDQDKLIGVSDVENASFNLTRSKTSTIGTVNLTIPKYQVSFEVFNGGTVVNEGFHHILTNDEISSAPLYIGLGCKFVGWYTSPPVDPAHYDPATKITNVDPSKDVWLTDNGTVIHVRGSAAGAGEYWCHFESKSSLEDIVWASGNLLMKNGGYVIASDPWYTAAMETGDDMIAPKWTPTNIRQWDDSKDPCSKIQGGKWRLPTSFEFLELSKRSAQVAAGSSTWYGLVYKGVKMEDAGGVTDLKLPMSGFVTRGGAWWSVNMISAAYFVQHRFGISDVFFFEGYGNCLSPESDLFSSYYEMGVDKGMVRCVKDIVP